MFVCIASLIKAVRNLLWRVVWGASLCLCSADLLAGEVGLAWSPSVGDDLGGYRIYYGLSSGNYTFSVDVGLQTTYTLPDLVAGQTYFIAVTAYDSNQTTESGFSNEVSITVPVLAEMTLDPNITVRIEEPSAGEIKGGVATLRGYATTPFGDCPITHIDLFIDDVFRGNIPLGGGRADVCDVFANPDCAISGYSQTINYSTLDEGSHAARVRAVDCRGNFNETNVLFSTARFANPFIADSNAIDFQTTQAFISHEELDKRIFLQSVAADGRCYDITLDYATEIQGWKIVAIQERAAEDCN